MKKNILCLIFLISGPLFSHAEAMLSGTPTICDMEWMRLKNLPPMGVVEYENMLKKNPQTGILGSHLEGEADYYYYLARIPFVIGKESLPTPAQRQKWLHLASEKDHKSAKAALRRIGYLGVIDPQSPSYSWPRYIPLEKKRQVEKNILKQLRKLLSLATLSSLP